MNEAEDRPSPENQLRHQAQMVLFETIISALTPVAVKGGETLYEKLRAQNPIFVQVLDSRLVQDRHEISFKVTNNTLHGAYLESISLVAPEGEYSVVIRGQSDPFFPVELPMLINPGKGRLFDVNFSKCQNRGLDSDWSGTLELLVSRLEDAKPESQQVKFRLRWQ